MTPEEAVKIIRRERDSMRRLVDDCNLPITGGYEYIEAYDMAIEALKAQLSNTSEIPNSSDMINRQAAIDEWKNDFKGYVNALNIPRDDYNGIMAYIDELPSAQPEQQWIPCRNHLPSLRDEIYLVSLAWGGVGTMEFKDTGWHNYGSLSPVPIETVTAWMPLPEAYKGEKK